ncbi:hypothetical protein HN588_12530 [Candidatus Bathyarchaeota archaeon]|jgi:hypothetical protein|nr:hypothetical protein [Candidatus Bathyarchaeota archaeon]
MSSDGTQVTELILCGWDEVFILDMAQQQDGVPKKTWSWRAEDRSELPEHMRSKFNSTDECKPFAGGKKLLITSSGDGVAVVDRETGVVSFYATVPNAHSAEILPGNRVAVAASHKDDAKGDRLIVFDLDEPEKELCSYELTWGHGVVWDEERQLLWALATREIEVFELEAWDTEKPSLARKAIIELPEGGGHDLYPIPGTSLLSVTTGRHCWLFDRDKRDFKLHPDLADERGVKSLSVNPSTGQLVYVQGEGGHWWSERVHFLHPEHALHFSGEHFYKVRWNVEVR